MDIVERNFYRTFGDMSGVKLLAQSAESTRQSSLDWFTMHGAEFYFDPTEGTLFVETVHPQAKDADGDRARTSRLEFQGVLLQSLNDREVEFTGFLVNAHFVEGEEAFRDYTEALTADADAGKVSEYLPPKADGAFLRRRYVVSIIQP